MFEDDYVPFEALDDFNAWEEEQVFQDTLLEMEDFEDSFDEEWDNNFDD